MRCVIRLHMLFKQDLPVASAVNHACQSQTMGTRYSGMDVHRNHHRDISSDVCFFGMKLSRMEKWMFRSVLGSVFQPKGV